jgi:hypothetical protein
MKRSTRACNGSSDAPNVSRFLTDPHVVSDALEQGYRAMAADAEHERQATEWIEGVIADVADEPG